jgi:prepilin-type N-terminal cleavage/methylation domain-containing protein
MDIYFKKSRGESGFTIVEMLVSVSIIAVISAITLTNYHESNQVAKLNAEVYKLASLIREVQDWSLGVKKTKDGGMPDAWGIEFSTQSAGNQNMKAVLKAYDITYIGGANSWSIDKSTTTSEQEFANGISVQNLISGSNPQGQKSYVIFKPPDPTTIICRVNGSNTNCSREFLDITLSDAFSSKQRFIKINRFGLINVD